MKRRLLVKMSVVAQDIDEDGSPMPHSEPEGFSVSSTYTFAPATWRLALPHMITQVVQAAREKLREGAL